MKKIINNKYIAILIILSIIFIMGITFFNSKLDLFNEKDVQALEQTDSDIYDDFTIKIDDINKLDNNEIQGYVYFGRDTCPVCLYFNKYLQNEYNKNNELVIYKFDTDFWRTDEKFQSILNKYTISSIPTLIKIEDSKTFEILEFDTENESEIQTALNNFLYK